MKFEIVVLQNYSGVKTKIYSLIIDSATESLYELFIKNCQNDYFNEVVNIDDRLKLIGNTCGIMEEYFNSNAGKRGQNLCTLRDRPKSNLRLFFIEYGNAAIIIGGGGVKPKNARTTQQVPELNYNMELLGLVSDTLRKAESKGHFSINSKGEISSTTEFIYDTNDYE